MKFAVYDALGALVGETDSVQQSLVLKRAGRLRTGKRGGRVVDQEPDKPTLPRYGSAGASQKSRADRAARRVS